MGPGARGAGPAAQVDETIATRRDPRATGPSIARPAACGIAGGGQRMPEPSPEAVGRTGRAGIFHERRSPSRRFSVNESSQTPIQDAVQSLRPHSLLVLICVVFAVGLAVGLSATQEKRYQATASLAFDNLSEDFAVVGSVGGAPESSSSLALRKSQTLLSTETLRDARRRLRDETTIASLRRRVTTAPEVTSNLVLVTAEATTAAGAAETANAVARAAAQRETSTTRRRFSEGAKELRRRYAALSPTERDASTRASYRERISRLDALASVASPARLDQEARPPDSPVSPKPARAGFIAGFAGLLVGISLAFGRNALDRRLRGVDMIRTTLDLPLVGQVREEAMGTAGRVNADTSPLSDVDLEGFRILRANLEFLTGGNAKTVLVTSPLPEEGKSTVAAALAWATAMSGRRTLLVECDLRRPSLAARLHVQATPGLVELLAGEVTIISDVVRVISADAPSTPEAKPHDIASQTLSCVLAGRQTPDPAAMLGSERFTQFLAAVDSRYEVVIFDSAPLLPVVDTLELFPSVDAAILCIRDGRTTRDQAAAARELVGNLGDRPIGLVVTGLKRDGSAGYGYYYSYSYEAR